ncbi:MAG: hypothetical protein JW982_04890 [Spirochaetes bacterium]|nr:hypothetical protein [Spirochaetota bacterium]
MSKFLTYRCDVCEKTSRINDGDPIPFCCGKIMQRLELDQCTDPKDAENSRFSREDDPCDDNRSN